MKLLFTLLFWVLHALTGAAQGAVLNEENRRAGALWGAIGGASSEMLMEAVYDPVQRSKALIKEMEQDLREGGMERLAHYAALAQHERELASLFDFGGEERARVLSRGEGGGQISTVREGETGLQAIARLQRESFPQQALQGMEIAFRRDLRRDVERTRDLVRTGMAFGSLMAGAQSRDINILDDTAYQATTHNFAFLALAAGGASFEAAGAGLLAAAGAGLSALGITSMWNEASRDTLPSEPVPLSLGWEYGADVSLMLEDGQNQSGSGPEVQKEKGGSGNKEQKKGQKKGPDKDPKEPKHPFPTPYFKRTNRNDKNQNDPNLSKETKEILKDIETHEKNLGPRDGKSKDATTLRAADIEKKGGQIDLAKERNTTFNHGHKVQDAQEGMMKNIDKAQNKLGDSKLPDSERGVLQKIISRTSKILDYTKKFVKPRTKTQRQERSLQDRNRINQEKQPGGKIFKNNIERKGE